MQYPASYGEKWKLCYLLLASITIFMSRDVFDTGYMRVYRDKEKDLVNNFIFTISYWLWNIEI